MSATTTSAYEWNKLPWRKLEQSVFKLQKRIYKASARGDTKSIHRLQRLLMKSEAARMLAVRKVTQDNRGKRTAGVDGAKNFAPKTRRGARGGEKGGAERQAGPSRLDTEARQSGTAAARYPRTARPRGA